MNAGERRIGQIPQCEFTELEIPADRMRPRGIIAAWHYGTRAYFIDRTPHRRRHLRTAEHRRVPRESLQRDRAITVEPRQVEGRRLGFVPGAHRVPEGVVIAVGKLPGEQPDQRGQKPDRSD